MSKILSKEIQAQLDNAWLNLKVEDRFIINPFERLKTDDPDEFYKRLTYLLTNPEYFSFVCKHILNIDILPFQALILKEMWNRKFPMLIGSRGLSKTFMLSLYSILRALLMPGRKVVVVGAAFRQSKFLHDYMENIWKNAPVLRDLCDANSGPRSAVDMCRMTINGSTVTAIPIGDGCCTAATLTTRKNGFYSIVEKSSSVWGNGKYRDIAYNIDNGIKPTKIVTTKKGFSYEATYNHAMKVLRDGEVLWVRTDCMHIGDIVLIDRSIRWHNGSSNMSLEDNLFAGKICREQNLDIPKDILSCSRDCMSLFLTGVFNLYDSGVCHDISLSSRNKTLLSQIQYILLHYGIVSEICKNTLHIDSDDEKRFCDFVIDRLPINNTKDSIFYDEIVSIENSESPTYDIHVPEGNEYCANGFFSHNSKIRGLRANDIIGDEFSSQSREIFENVIAGFAAVSANPVENVKNAAKVKAAESLGIKLVEDDKIFGSKDNQIILSGTAYYDFNHFADYWKRWKAIIETRGDKHKLSQNVFGGGVVPDSFRWDDYSVIRIPVDLLPPKFMDEGTIARSKATVHNGIYLMEFGACGLPETEIVTDKGLKQITDVEIGDLVLTHKGRFRKVTNKTFRDYNGKISSLKSFGYYKNYEFTSDHPFWTGDDKFIELENIGSHLSMSCLNELGGLYSIDTTKICTNYVDRKEFIYPRSSQTKIDNDTRKLIIERMRSGETAISLANEYGVSLTCINTIKYDTRKPKNSIPRNIKLDYDFGLCIGYYASEGSLDAEGRAVSFALDGHVDVKLSSFIEELSNALYNSIGLTPKTYKSSLDNVMRVNVNSRVFGEVVKYICPGDCYSKFINHDVLFSNEDFLRGFIVGMFNGDGHKRNNSATIQLANKNMIYQIKLALSYFGVNCSLVKPKRPKSSIIKGKGVNLSEVWKLNLYGTNFRDFMEIFYNKKIEVPRTRKSQVFCKDRICKNEVIENSFIDYCGRVYNLEVEEDNSYSLPNATVHNCFAKDSQGFFKRSLIESCVGTDIKPVNGIWFDPRLKGDKKLKYVMAVDPASEVDNFSIIILELHGDHRRVVYCWTTTRKEHIDRVSKGLTTENNFYTYCARKIRELMDLFPVVHIAMDSQGGGYAVSEALHDTNALKEGEQPIWPIIDPDDPQPSDDEKGLHMLEMCTFAKYEWYSGANHGLRKDLEDKAILFPRFDPITIGLSIEEDKANNRTYDTLEDCIMDIEELKNELSLIEITTSSTGRERWDTPEVKVGVNKKTRMRKDRYSALMMANMSARSFSFEEKQNTYTYYGGFSNRGEPTKSKESATFSGPNWFTEQMNGVY